MKRRYEFFPTSTLRAMRIALAKKPWCWILRKTAIDIEGELLLREIASIADESGGFAVAPIEGMH